MNLKSLINMLILSVLFALTVLASEFENIADIPKPSVRKCAKSRHSISHVNEEGHPVAIVNASTDCEKDTNHCYALFIEDPNNSSNIIVMGQGCWAVSGGENHDCDRTECISDRKPPKAMKAKFCCCFGDMCNAYFIDAYVPKEETTMSASESISKDNLRPSVWILVAVLFAFLMLFIALIVCFWWRKKPKKSDVEMGPHPSAQSSDFSLDKLKMLTIIGQGRYGTVWRGLIDDQEVAVKVFSAHYRNYFLNEHEVYKEASENQCLLKCFGGGERISPNGSVDYLLVLSLEKECLQEYLKNRTIDLATLCKMSLGIAKGLAHLHSDLGKLCIAHRDINTRNILVRHDLSCCICDLGLAVIPRKTENKSLSEAGTLRYMAPEVLEGAVNLRDCESALKQVDVYALGLVLWELGTRCVDMQVAEPQTYMPPFYKEAGDNPTLEQMQTLVSRRKARPLWPPSWKDTAAARLLCETAEDCWDQDAEARLTSLCVEERLLELPTLRGRVLHPMHPPASPTPLINNNHLHDHTIDASVGTIETLLSPSEENCKNSNQLAVCVTPIQPYQGRNPCLERNLLTGSTDSLLIDKSSKHCMSSESQNLITNDYLNFQINHRAMPIPYLQNAVHGTFLDAKPMNNVNLISKSKSKWSAFKKLFHGKKEKLNPTNCKETQVKIVPGKLVNSFGQNGVTTSLLTENEVKRPSTLPLTTVKAEEVETAENKCNLAGVSQILKNKNSLLRQRSLEQFTEVFSSTTDLSRLKNPSQRVKTPGDVPPSVRRTRGKAAKESSARFSLYDDRMMTHGQWGSAPDLEPQMEPLKPPQLHDLQDRDSVSSF